MKRRRVPAKVEHSANAQSATTATTDTKQFVPPDEALFIDSFSDLESLQTTPSTFDEHAHIIVSSETSATRDLALRKKDQHVASTRMTHHTDGAVPHKRAKFSAEVRKARHRDRMQRVRMAEKQDLEVKRVEMESLEVQLQSSIEGYCSQDQQGGERNGDEDDDDAGINHRTGQLLAQDHQHKSPQTLRRKYVNLVLQQDQVKRENSSLVRRIQDFEKYEKLVTGELERVAQETVATSTHQDVPVVGPARGTAHAIGDGEGTRAATGGYWLAFTENEPHLYFEPLNWTICQEIALESYNHMLTLQRGLPNPTMPGECLGWKVSYATLRKMAECSKVTMQHRSVKRINPFLLGTLEKITIDSLGENTWKIVNSSELYRQIYKTNMMSRVLQEVDDHTSVLLRTYPDERQVMRARFLSLISKMEDKVTDAAGKQQRRVSVLLSVLDPDEWLKTGTNTTTSSSSDSHVNWIKDGVAYFSFKDVNNGQEIEMEYGGYLDVASEELQPAVMRNMLEAIVRFERGVTRTDAMLLTSA